MRPLVTSDLAAAAEAAHEAVSALQARDAAIARAHESGATVRAIAAAVNLSPARVHQIVQARSDPNPQDEREAVSHDGGRNAGSSPRVSPARNWMIVRKSRTVIGGYKVVAYGLSESSARERAARYKRPAEVMTEPDLLGLRLKALDERDRSAPSAT